MGALARVTAVGLIPVNGEIFSSNSSFFDVFLFGYLDRFFDAFVRFIYNLASFSAFLLVFSSFL